MQSWFLISIIIAMYIDSLVTKYIKKQKQIKQDNTEHKTYRRHIPLTVNSVNRLNIKHILKILLNTWSERDKKKKKKREN